MKTIYCIKFVEHQNQASSVYVNKMMMRNWKSIRIYLCYLSCINNHGIVVCLPSQSASEKQSRKKSPWAFAHFVNFSKNVSVTFDNHTILLFWLQNRQTFSILSLLDLCFVLCSLDLNVLRAQRIMGFLFLITHKRGQKIWSHGTYDWYDIITHFKKGWQLKVADRSFIILTIHIILV